MIVIQFEISGGHHPLGLQGGIGPGAAEAGGRGEDVARPHTASGEQSKFINRHDDG